MGRISTSPPSSPCDLAPTFHPLFPVLSLRLPVRLAVCPQHPFPWPWNLPSIRRATPSDIQYSMPSSDFTFAFNPFYSFTLLFLPLSFLFFPSTKPARVSLCILFLHPSTQPSIHHVTPPSHPRVSFNRRVFFW